MAWQPIEWSILLPAFAAGLLVLATHVPLGMQVLARGIVFIDLAIAQIAALGVIAAEFAGLAAQGVAAQLSAVGAALAGALLLTFTERYWPAVQEALIGVLFVLAATGGVLLLAHDPHGGEHLRELLVGQILWVTPAQLGVAAVVTAAVLAAWFGAGVRLGRIGFYLLFAVAVTTSVQLVGVFLVFASLIVPALGTLRWGGVARFAWAYAIGVLGYGLGLTVSAGWDLPSGAVVVWVMAAVALAVAGLVRRSV